MLIYVYYKIPTAARVKLEEAVQLVSTKKDMPGKASNYLIIPRMSKKSI